MSCQRRRHPIYLFADPHADADAMLASLVASGGVRKTGPGDKNFELTGPGKRARFIVGGDCFDKGPSNLRLLRTLAGNHDVRIMLGMRSVVKCRGRQEKVRPGTGREAGLGHAGSDDVQGSTSVAGGRMPGATWKKISCGN